MRTARSGFHAFAAGIAVACTALSCMAPTPAGAGVGEYDYAVERVTVDGGVYGVRDGTPDAIEEAFQENWATSPLGTSYLANWGSAILFDHYIFGTVRSLDGALHLMSPGTVLDLPSLGLSLVQTDVITETPLLRDGAGDARVEVVFQPATLGLNHYVHATFLLTAPVGGGFAGLAYANFDEQTAQRQLGPAIAGPSMFAHLLNGYVPVGGQSVPIEPSSTGGSFVLAFDYDDTAKALTPSFSLDGGATFTGGLDPLPIAAFDGSGIGTAQLLIGADPRTPFDPDACPIGLFRRLSPHTVSVGRRGDASTLSFSAVGLLDSRAGVFDPVSEGAQLTITDRGTATDLVHLAGSAAVPPGAPGSGCDPRDGWTATGTTRFVYRNYSNAFPPGCAPGSANGLTFMKARARRLYGIKVSATVTVSADPASIVGPVYSLFVRGQGGDTDGGGACLAVQSDDTSCVSSTRRVRCKYPRSH